MTPTPETRAEIERFFESYGRAFERFDLEAILDHFAFPCHFVSDADPVALVPVASREACGAGVRRILDAHGRLGVAAIRLPSVRIDELTPRLASVAIRCELLDGEGRPLYEFQGVYSLVRTERGRRIAAIAHDQIHCLTACLASRSSN